jgi:hypothetical protein
VLVVGPAGAGKTRMLTAAREDLHAHTRPVFGLAPTAKAARVLERDTGMVADTVAKLLHEWSRVDRPPEWFWQLPAQTTVVVDEAGMISTPDLHRLVTLARQNDWRLALVGDPRQLQAVGRGGLFDELCFNGRVEALQHVHRFTHRWEAEASLQLRVGDPRALDAYEAHGRIRAGTIEEHLAWIGERWIDNHHRGHTTSLVASTNEHVDTLNAAVQTARVTAGHLNPNTAVAVGGGEHACIGDVIATRRNDRRLVSTTGEAVRNRDLWSVTETHFDGSLTVSHTAGHGHVILPGEYVREHVRLGYAATEPGYQSDTVNVGIELAGAATTRRGLYVAVTRGQQENWICVITQSPDVADARDLLETMLAVDRADIPAVTQRRHLAEQTERVERTASHPPQPGRCDVPDWFADLKRHTSDELERAIDTVETNARERERLQRELPAAQNTLARIDDETWPERNRFQRAERDRDEARWDRAAAERRLESSGLRGRRHARREFTAADNTFRWAEQEYEQVRADTGPDVERYHQAWNHLDQLHDELRNQHALALLDRWTTRSIPQLEQRLDALDTWQRWAIGDGLDVPRLGNVVHTLLDASGDHASHFHSLGEAMKNWCVDAGIDLPTPKPPAPTLEISGPELGFDSGRGEVAMRHGAGPVEHVGPHAGLSA